MTTGTTIGSSFIALITLGSAAHLIPPHQPRQFSFGAFVRDYLEQNEGIAMLVLSTPDAKSDAARFAEQGVGAFEPFSFERKAKKPDSSETHVAFTLALASDPAAPHAGFFVCRQHFPENFWNKSFQQHANSATNIATVTLASSDPKQHAEFLTKFIGAEKERLPDNRLRFTLDGDRIEAVSAIQTPMPFRASPMLNSFSVQVADTNAVMRLLNAERIPFTISDDGIALAPATCFGVELRFEASPGKRT